MSYQHCPSCRLTVRVDGPAAADRPCPRCGAKLGDEPPPVFAELLPAARFARARSTLTPGAVRTAMAARRGRFRRDGDSLSGRS